MIDMESVSLSACLEGRTVLVPPDAWPDLAATLKRYGARVISWPRVKVSEPESLSTLDEAIENLFGYDWLVFQSFHAAEYFLQRLHAQGHEIGELDTLRVCAMSEVTAAKLQASQVHIDLIPASPTAEAVFAAIECYVGGREALGRLNLLVPRASMKRDALTDMLEDAGARVDWVKAYRICSEANTSLALINALLTGGGIDCIAFTTPSDVRNFGEWFDTKELVSFLKSVPLACIDKDTARTILELGLSPEIHRGELTILGFVQFIVSACVR